MLLVTQSHYWIHLCRTTRGDQRCTERYGEERQRNRNVGGQVGGADAEQEVPNEPHASQGACHSQHDTALMSAPKAASTPC